MIKKVLVVDDDTTHRDLYSENLRRAGFSVTTAEDAECALTILSHEIDMVVSDVRMPGIDGITFLKEARKQGFNNPFLLVTAFPAIKDAVAALKLGAVDYLQKPVDLKEMICAVRDSLNMRNTPLPSTLPPEVLENIVAESPIMLECLSECYTIAQSDATVLITGESGTGKEVISSFIHKNSSRNKVAPVTVNCAAIPENLLAGELFGHRKGAFTGASEARLGKFKEADGGILFLDEIGDMSLQLQPILLRALEIGMIAPVGSDREEFVDVRIVAATNKDLKEEVAAGRFREDLYYRLNVIAVNLPPLSQRSEDIIPLARFFLKEVNGSKRLSPLAANILKNYNWPGNIRELSNAMERAKVMAMGDVILPEHLPPVLCSIDPRDTNSSCSSSTVVTMEETERLAIKKALESTNGNRTRAAELLNISRRSLIYKIKRYEL